MTLAFRHRLTVALVLVLVALVAAPAGPVGAATWNGRYSVWRAGAFAPQYLDASCVGATIQIMLNLVDGRSNASKRRQLSYLDYAQRNSKYPVEDDGADPQGWAEALVHFGAGAGYGWITAPTMQQVLHAAAQQMRETGKPIGLLVHFGRHAWVMTGFEASADPAQTNDFEVTAAEVVGPLWPDGTLDGQPFDPGPRTWMTLHELGRKFNAYVVPDQPVWHGKYVIVVPRASAVAPDQAPDGQPDLASPVGWITLFNDLALRTAVRDFLWLP